MNLPALDETPAPEPERRGLLLLADVFVSPKRAFATIAQTKEWIPAALVTLVLLVSGSLMLGPAIEHLIPIWSAADPTLSAPSPAGIKTAAGYAVANAIVQQILTALMFWVWTAVVMATLTRSGPRGFSLYFALAVDTALPSALGTFFTSVAIAFHDPHSFANLSQLNRALPDSLAIFEPVDNERAVEFLASFDIFGLWSTLLLAFGVRAIGKIELFWALVAAFSLWLALALYQVFASH